MPDLPDDLLDWLNAYEWDDQQPNVAHRDHRYDAWCAICRGDLPRLFTALAEWADGALIDPDGWRRLDASSDGAGVDYCTAHAGLRNEDEGVCDMVSLADLCPECGGDETVRCQDRECEPDDGDHHEHYIQCPSCDGLGVTPCALVPLHTLTPRETTP